MLIKEVIDVIENYAPISYQENYDNSGLITGNTNMELTGVLICLDSTEEVIDEAIIKGCNIVIAHHPIVFSGLKKITGKNYIERTIIKAIKNDIAIYAVHTNLDNCFNGVSYKIAEQIGLKNIKTLAVKDSLLSKLVVFCPTDSISIVKAALFEAGAGSIGNYDNCSFSLQGKGTFKANNEANPHLGEKNKLHTENEIRVEVIVENHLLANVINNMIQVHPYEEVAYDIFPLSNSHQRIGSGVIAELEESETELDFLKRIKKELKSDCIRYTKLKGTPVKKIAICGGAGSFLLKKAISQQADVFITGDFKYHQFFDADNQIVIADVGHYESEQFTKELIYSVLKKKIHNFAIHISEKNTNPINYLK